METTKIAIIDEDTSVGLGLKNDVAKNNKFVIFPKRTGTFRSMLPISPQASWKIQKVIADYIGLVPAVILNELISMENYFKLDYQLEDNYPFIIGESEIKAIANSVGISLVMCKVILNTLLEEKLLVNVLWKEGHEPLKLLKRIKFNRVQRLQELEYEWYQLDYTLMDKLFFPKFA